MRKRWIVLGVLLVAVVAGWASGFFHAFVISFLEGRRAVLEGHPGLPSCDGELGLLNAKAAINNSPYGVTVLGLSDAKAISVSNNLVECEGMVTLSSGVRGPILYSFKKDPSVDAPFLVKVQIEPNKLEKF